MILPQLMSFALVSVSLKFFVLKAAAMFENFNTTLLFLQDISYLKWLLDTN